MRVSTAQIADGSIYGITQAYSRFAAAQSEISSGKQLQEPSDDPAGLAQSLNFQNQLDQITQYQTNITQAKSFLGTTDTALSSVNDLLRQARTIAVQGASTNITSDAQSALVAQVQNIITQLGNIANTTYGTQYVFAGQRTDKAPFTANVNGTFTYNGGSDSTYNGALNLDIGRGETVQTNVPGDAVFNPIFSALTQLKTDLEGGNTTAISNNDISGLDSQISSVLTVRADIGSKVQRVDQENNRYAVTKDNLTQLISTIEDADYAKTVVEYQTAQTSYQAAIQSTAKVFQNSLLDFLK